MTPDLARVQVVYVLTQPYLPLAVRAVALSGILGFTLQIALVSDLLSLVTLHISIFYTISARLAKARRKSGIADSSHRAGL